MITSSSLDEPSAARWLYIFPSTLRPIDGVVEPSWRVGYSVRVFQSLWRTSSFLQLSGHAFLASLCLSLLSLSTKYLYVPWRKPSCCRMILWGGTTQPSVVGLFPLSCSYTPSCPPSMVCDDWANHTPNWRPGMSYRSQFFHLIREI